MKPQTEWMDRFVGHLEELRGDRGALAALRRGLGQPPGTVACTYRHVLPWAPALRKGQDVCYITASLFALHSTPGGTGTLGGALARMQAPSDSLEMSFVALLDTEFEDLPDQLRRMVSRLKAKDISVDWRQFIKDVFYWDHESRFVQERWAREFWQHGQTEPRGGESETAIAAAEEDRT